MIYRAIGLMSGSSLDGLDIAFVEFHENGGKWTSEILQADCVPYPDDWVVKLKEASSLPASDYLLLHASYGRYLGELVNRFIEQYDLHFKVALIASHGHTVFHMPEQRMTAQLGDGAAIAAVTGIPVVSDLRAIDVALGGQGAPIVPVGEKLLFDKFDYYLNIGGIANISFNTDPYIAFDVCPANRVLNMLALKAGRQFDENGNMASTGRINNDLLKMLNQLDYYSMAYPKSLANDFGTGVVYPIIEKADIPVEDALHTYVEHIALQIKTAIATNKEYQPDQRMLVTGGGALNTFLMERLRVLCGVEIIVPDEKIIKYKEALVMALMGVLRWREEVNVLHSVTGALKDSVGGAFWMG